MPKALYISFLLYCVIECSEQDALMSQASNSFIIHITEVRPDPKQFLLFLENDLKVFPKDINNIILQYARWQRDEKGEAEARELTYKLQEAQKSKYLSIAGLIGSGCVFTLGAIAISTGDLLDPQSIKSWAIPLISTALGSSVIGSCIDRWCVFKKRHFPNRKEIAKFVRPSLYRICCTGYLPSFLLMSLKFSTDAQKMGQSDLYVGGYGTIASIYFLREAIKQRNLLQLNELNQHLREELYQPVTAPFAMNYLESD